MVDIPFTTVASDTSWPEDRFLIAQVQVDEEGRPVVAFLRAWVSWRTTLELRFNRRLDQAVTLSPMAAKAALTRLRGLPHVDHVPCTVEDGRITSYDLPPSLDRF